MNLKLDSLLVGLLAGVASAILLLSAGQPSLLSIPLFAAAALPIFIAGLGWSNQASLAAVIAACLILFATKGIEAAFINLIITLLPSAFISHLTTLARPASEMGGPDDQLVWYPFAQILLHICTMMVLATILIGWMIGYGPEISAQVIDAFIQILQESGEADIPAQNIEQMTSAFTMLIPMVQSAMWVIILFISWYFAGHIVRRSGRAKRPRDNMHIMLRMPPLSIILFGIGMALTFASGPISYIGASMVGGFGAGLMLAGLAFLHYKTVGKVWRYAALWGSYTAILLFSFPAAIFVVIGMLQTSKPVPMLVSQHNSESKE